MAVVICAGADMADRQRRTKGSHGWGVADWGKNLKGVFPRHISEWENRLGPINKMAPLNFAERDGVLQP